MREIVEHKVNGLNEALGIHVLDEPGPGGACHHYQIDVNCESPKPTYVVNIKFQEGPIKESGINGISQEALLAIVIDRLRGFQDGEFSCRDNAIALTHVENALLWLQKRTRERMLRGVEGTNQK